MIFLNPSRKPASEYTPIPSEQMIIRRYRSLSEKCQLETYFTEGLFCNHLTNFEDKNEGILQHPGGYGSLKGGLAADSTRRRQRTGEAIDTASDEEFQEALNQYHRDSRRQHFANCWRLGTEEKDDIWKYYTQDDEMKAGCAVETTVGQLVAGLPSRPAIQDKDEVFDPEDITETSEWNLSFTTETCDIRFGACRYQQEENPTQDQPAGWNAAITFFKGERFDDEIEFRILVNPFTNNGFIESAADGTPVAFRPDLEEDPYRKLPAATEWMTNRLILAPNATGEEQDKVESWLNEFGVVVGSGSDADLEVIESTDSGATLQDEYEYTAELAGLANYDGSVKHLEDAMGRFLMKRDWDVWPVVDLVEINSDNAGTFLEAYWHRSENPVFEMDEYGHHDIQRVWVRRFTDPTEEPEIWKNTLAEEYEESSKEHSTD
ncbi:hypothetical protein [Haloferax gibbonsii]|uniref:Uncharacterized protein n=1 Tax=Haloferax gibbonsii TaxID=35746 RepID=A0A0K1J011_HALGI|nr:hypothetical protein [Haloferax gibbonsii]AKU09885.1 hypothetical protein ABY42_18885 [Haloferax gibbonsii]